MSRVFALPAGTQVGTIAFGCAGLFREPSRSRRRRVLDAAWEAGIRHFDTAPMYGLGLSEGELSHFLERRRSMAFVATKFGIAPTTASKVLGRAQGPIRRLLEGSPALTGAVKRSGATPNSGSAGRLLYERTGYDAVTARRSLVGSLRTLRTDYLDLFLLHDPEPGSVRSDEIKAFLSDRVVAGVLRSWGVAGELQPTAAEVARLDTESLVVQCRYDIIRRSLYERLESSWKPRHTVLFGVLGESLSVIGAHLQSGAGVRERWSGIVGVDCARPDHLAPVLLADALLTNTTGVVLFSTIRPERIATTLDAVQAHLQQTQTTLGAPPAVVGLRAVAGMELTDPCVTSL